jgi:uncharacterized protein (DUF2384 family)
MARRFNAESLEITPLGRLHALAEYVWGDRGEAYRWMYTAHVELSGQTPIEASSTKVGVDRAEDMLNRLFYGRPT